jgi:hypothetical protein
MNIHVYIKLAKIPDTAEFHEKAQSIFEWLNEHGGLAEIDWQYESAAMTHRAECRFSFADPRKATLFKLTFA